MEIESVRRLLSEVALARPNLDDSEVREFMRKISLALLQMAEGITEIQRTQAAMRAHSRSIRRSELRKRRAAASSNSNEQVSRLE